MESFCIVRADLPMTFPIINFTHLSPYISFYFIANGYTIMGPIMFWEFTPREEWFCLKISVPECHYASKDVIYELHNIISSTSYLSVKLIVQKHHVKIFDFDQKSLGQLWCLGFQLWPHTITVKYTGFRCFQLYKNSKKITFNLL